MQKLTVFFVSLFSVFVSSAQVTQPSGVVSYGIKKEAITAASQLSSLTASERSISIGYVDGLGRPLESIAVGASPNGKDLISFSQYDDMGRRVKQYLPYEGSTGTGIYTDIATAITNQGSFYSSASKVAHDVSPFAESEFETSPLQRVLKAGSIGDGFQLTQNYKTLSYRSNDASTETVRKWTISSGVGSSSGSYSTNDLSVAEVVDENAVHARVYKDKFGRLVLKRQDGAVSGYSDTYYVYDNIGNIIFIVPPKAVAKMASVSSYSTSVTPDLIFQFWYDGKNRVSEKKVPGAVGRQYIIYDAYDRVVLMQDGNMRGGTKWSYIKYDYMNRVVITGIYTHGGSSSITQPTMQGYVDLNYTSNFYEYRSNGTSGYSNACFPTSGTEERTYNYYDDYDFDYNGTADYAHVPQGLTNEATATTLTHGLATGSKRKILGSGTPGDWLLDVTYYDKYYHVIQVRSNNQVKLVYTSTVADHATNVVDFSGKLVESMKLTNINDPVGIINNLEIEVHNKYEYDDAGRLTEVRQINGLLLSGWSSYITVGKYEYNGIGQLIDKKLHSTDNVNYLQSVDMRYNIRGQLTSINNSALASDGGVTNDESNDLFGMELLYDNVDSKLSNTASFTGMISAVKWKATSTSGTATELKSYLYTYDKLYRLNLAYYSEYDAINDKWSQNADAFDEAISYDENGNITALQRKALLGGSIVTIDNLTYTYKSSGYENQLDNITDGVSTITAGYGYRNLTGSGSAYTYDDNGNLLTDPKKGTTFTYNEYNKPTKIEINSNKKVEYRYDAAGNRISKYVRSGLTIKQVEYIGAVVVEDAYLSYYGMAEGRVRNDASPGSGLDLKMEYFVSDQQGNVRLTFEDDGTSTNTAKVSQETGYYAFGMQMAGGSASTNPNKKLYNAGSEWQDDIAGLADYYSTYFREYDPMIGRFNGVDPMAVATDDMTTYAYANNNPIMMNDPLGANAANAEPSGMHWYGPRMRDVVDDFMRMYGAGDWTFGGAGGGGGGGVGGRYSTSYNMYMALKGDLESFGTGNEYASQARRAAQGNYFRNLLASHELKEGSYWFNSGDGTGGYNEDPSFYSRSIRVIGTIEKGIWNTKSVNIFGLEGGTLSKRSFHFNEMTTNMYEAGVSDLFFVQTIMTGGWAGSTPTEITIRRNFGNIYVGFPSRTAYNRHISPEEAAARSAEGFNNAALAMALRYKGSFEMTVRMTTDMQFESEFRNIAAKFISASIFAGATVGRIQNGYSTVTTPAVWKTWGYDEGY